MLESVSQTPAIDQNEKEGKEIIKSSSAESAQIISRVD
jgi:hypothetical protein